MTTARGRARTEIGIAGPAFGDWAFGDLLDLMDELGFYRLDCSYKHIAALGAQAMRDQLDHRGMSAVVVSVSPYLGRIGETAGTHRGRQALLTAIADAEVLGARCVQFHTAIPDTDDADQARAAIAEDLGPAATAARNAGVRLVMENNFDSRSEDPRRRNPARDPAAMAALIEAIGPQTLGVTFDACNFYLAGAEAYPHAFRLLAGAMANVHLKDATRYDARLYSKPGNLFSDAHTGQYLPVPVGQGALPWAEILLGLDAANYGGELFFEATTSDGDPSRWLRESLEFVTAIRDRLGIQYS